MIAQLLFVVILGAAIYLFSKNVGKIRRNILLGKDVEPVGQCGPAVEGNGQGSFRPNKNGKASACRL